MRVKYILFLILQTQCMQRRRMRKIAICISCLDAAFADATKTSHQWNYIRQHGGTERGGTPDEIRSPNNEKYQSTKTAKKEEAERFPNSANTALESISLSELICKFFFIVLPERSHWHQTYRTCCLQTLLPIVLSF